MPGPETLVAHVFVAGDHNSDSDATFSVKQELIAEFARYPTGKSPDGPEMAGGSHQPNCDFALKHNGGAEAKGSGVPVSAPAPWTG